MTPSEADIRLIEQSELFDADWYEARYQDVAAFGSGAAVHYLRIGARLLRDPGPNFSTSFYVDEYRDVALSRQNPLLHYIVHGRSEGRACLPPERRGTSAVHASQEDAEKFATGRWREFPGHLNRDPHTKTVLVCGHAVVHGHLYGGERSLLDILDGFAGAAYNVVVAMPGVFNHDYLEALRNRSIAVVDFPYSWWSGKPVEERVVATFASVISAHAIDAVHANTIVLREPLVAARRMAIPAVVHVRELVSHDIALCEFIQEPPDRIIQQVLNNADWIVANSEATARAFDKPGATIVVPNTVQTHPFGGIAPAASGPIRIGMVSSNLPKKGIQDFVAVANLLESSLPDVHFVLIGPENEHTQALRKQQEWGAISGNLVFGRYRDNPVAAISELDVVVNLSHFQESFGRTVLEAMAGGRPVIVYDWGALPELVEDGCTGYVVPFKDVRAVAERVQALCADRNAIRAMGDAARARAAGLFSMPHYIERLRRAYSRVFAADTQPAPLTLPARHPTKANEEEAPLRIAYFLWHFPVPSETFVLNELRILVAEGHDVEVYCHQSPHKDFAPDFPIRWTRVADAKDLARRLTETGRNIVHSHFTYPTVTDMVWPACEEAKVPFTFIAHAQDIFRYANDDKNRIGQIGQSPWCLRVVVPSRFHRSYVEARGVPASKLLINPNGIDPDLYTAGQVSNRARRSARSICAIHRFTAKKGLDRLIRAATSLAQDGVSIHIYGYGELEESYRSLIEELGLANVHVHGPVRSRGEMLDVFREHDLFACPSVRAPDGDMDGIPTVLMEAMASGLPVLATDISGIPDLVQDEITGIVCGAEPCDIVDAVRRYYALPEAQVEAIIEDAKKHVRNNFNAERLSATLVRLWRHRTVDVMIVSWNNLPQLREVMGRLHRYTSLPFHLVVCDNGSSPDVGAFLCREYAEHDNLTVVFNRENVFVGPGTNICLAQGVSDYAVYVCGKEGFVLDYGWEKDLVDYMDANPRVGLAGTLCHSPSYLTGARYPEGIPLFPKFRNPSFAMEAPDRRFGHVQGGFFVIRRSMVEEIGGFSTEVPHSYTDVEFSYYVESTGWQLGTPPRVLSLYNKTRPGLFSRIDEQVAATHPPQMGDLPLLSRIAKGNVAHCNVCGWHGDSFDVGEPGAPSCPDCSSTPADRSLYRFLAESVLTYRRLPALGVNVGVAMEGIWRDQFPGELVTSAILDERLGSKGLLDISPASLKLVYYNDIDTGSTTGSTIHREVDRVLAPDGVLVLHVAPRDVPGFVDACGLVTCEAVRFSSRVVRYDYRPLFVGRRRDVAQCVS